ncbi:hypothetical protein L3V79_09190 [Thiotrichales bacterium 19S9-12]|nr:hypothetical protein [Thiotrichales bacterium 19S9-11]MCF6812532.1 hypothetical protein [Thiotrichales bacterium 19S9-12]
MFKNELKKLFERSGNANKKARIEQLKTLSIVIVFILIGIGFYFYSTQKHKPHKSSKPIHFSGAFDDNVGLAYDHAKIEAITEKLDRTNSKLSELEKQKKAESSNHSEKLNVQTLKQMEAMQKELKNLKRELYLVKHAKTTKQNKVTPKSINSVSEKHEGVAPSKSVAMPYQAITQTPIVSSLGIEDVNISYPEDKKEQMKRTPKNYVWAGTFANGYLITGIIGDAGTNSTKNTGTVAIRLTTNGTMPNGKTSHLKNCVVLGSTYGDLSSDSDVVHLETLSCAGKEYSFEKKVYGSVFDLDAMQDIRGVPVLKAKPILGYAAVAGLISGIGDGLSSSGQTSTVTGSGVVTTPTSALKSGIGEGISQPSDKITDYLMSIANIYHPIVVVRAGRKVTVLFQAGFWIDQAHQDFESMKSVNDSDSKNLSNHLVEKVSTGFVNNPFANAISDTSKNVQREAQSKANAEFNANQQAVNQSIFSPVSQGVNL